MMNRLKEIRKEFKLTQTQLAEKIGRKQHTISDMEKNKYPMEKIMALAIEAVLGINADWLLTGEGQKYKKGASLGNIKNQPDLAWASRAKPGDKIIMIPIFGVVPGKPLIKNEDNVEEVIELSRSILPDEVYNIFALRVKDDSMIHSGIKRDSIAVINEQSDVKSGEIAVVLYGDEISLKKYYLHTNNVILRSDNPVYKDIMIPREDEDEVKILGRVILSISTWVDTHYLKPAKT